MGNLNLEMRVGESSIDYCHRLFAIYSLQVGIIGAYEREKELERLRHADKTFKDLLENGNPEDVQKARDGILTLQKEVEGYKQNFPKFLYNPLVKEKLNGLDSIT